MCAGVWNSHFSVMVDQAWQVIVMQVFLLSVNIVLGVEG